jgi:ATP-dependent 26S proteasome regulatory subunit
MDGLRDDADILFILTTNRPEDIEEALASRPGRVDEAIEMRSADGDCRARIALLYNREPTFDEGQSIRS